MCPGDPVRCLGTLSPSGKGRSVWSFKLIQQGPIALTVSYCTKQLPACSVTYHKLERNCRKMEATCYKDLIIFLIHFVAIMGPLQH